MSSWLATVPYKGNADAPTLERLFAVWHPDQAEALRLAAEYTPRGSSLRPRTIIELDDSVLRGLHLKVGQTGVSLASRPFI